MPNPSGPYPGRQLFLGLTMAGKLCLAYLITGRSPESRQRKVTAAENTVRVGALSGNTPFEPLRFHYTALKHDNSSGFATVTNGLQTEAIFETYKLLFDVGTPATKDYMEKLLDGANSEPDSLNTPRIGGVILAGKSNPVFILGIKTHLKPAVAHQLTPAAGNLSGISTYRGSFDNPEATDPKADLSQIKFTGNNAQELAKYLYDISAASYKGEDIRVCALGSVYSGTAWDIAIISKY
jgi:IMP cyclohydrolase